MLCEHWASVCERFVWRHIHICGKVVRTDRHVEILSGTRWEDTSMQCNTVSSPWRKCWWVRSSELPWAGSPHDARSKPQRSLMSPYLKHSTRVLTWTQSYKSYKQFIKHFKKCPCEVRLLLYWNSKRCIPVFQWSQVHSILLFSLIWGLDFLMLSTSEERRHKMFTYDFYQNFLKNVKNVEKYWGHSSHKDTRWMMQLYSASVYCISRLLKRILLHFFQATDVM